MLHAHARVIVVDTSAAMLRYEDFIETQLAGNKLLVVCTGSLAFV